jgi:hypothetical protein
MDLATFNPQLDYTISIAYNASVSFIVIRDSVVGLATS